VAIRVANEGDRSELTRLVQLLFPHHDDAASDVDGYLAENLEKPTAVFVAERESGGLCGFIEVGTRSYAEGCVSSPVPYVEAWYVDADVRRRGVGRALFAAAEHWARELGFSEIARDVVLENTTSQAAHRALGYEETDRLVCFRRSLC
jgi:aminoglycoside 6'-N-acetyltransferase I